MENNKEVGNFFIWDNENSILSKLTFELRSEIQEKVNKSIVFSLPAEKVSYTMKHLNVF